MKLGRFTFYTPKYWTCKNYPRDLEYKGYQKFSRDSDEEVPDWYRKIVDEDNAYHAKCKWKWHRAQVGYMYWTKPGGRYVFWYMGNPFRHKLFENQGRPNKITWA